jgi:putative membrane protein
VITSTALNACVSGVRDLSRRRAAPVSALAVVVATAVFWALLPSAVAAHGYQPAPASALDFVLTWQIELSVVVPVVIAALLYAWAANRIAQRHPANPVPRYRELSWYAGLLAIVVALESPIGAYDTTFFSVHMIQHLALMMVAAPLLAIGAPITLLLRVASGNVRRRYLLPILHSRVMRFISFPVTTWLVFAAVLWATHFSPLFNESLDNETVHIFEHALYMVAALLFWWPVVGADPSPWRLPHPGRVLYLFLGMPQCAFLGLAIYSAPDVLYEHYATVVRSWGPSPLADQAWAGAIMWLGGVMMLFIALAFAVWVWLRAEEAEGRRVDAQLDRELARKLAAERLAHERNPSE